MDSPRTFKVKVEYVITVGHPVMTADDVRQVLERRVAEVIFELRQERNIDVDVVNSAVITEEIP